MDVADRGNARLQIFDSTGRLLDTWDGAEYGRPSAVRVGPDGVVYVVDGGDRRDGRPARPRILVCDQDGDIREAVELETGADGTARPHAIAVGGDGALYVGYAFGTGVRKLEPQRETSR